MRGSKLSLFIALTTVAVPLSFTAAQSKPSNAQNTPTVIAFAHVSVIPMDTDRVLTDQTVVIRDGQVSAVGPAAEVAIPKGATQIDGQGKFLIPGLADMHTHMQFQDSIGNERYLLKLVRHGTTTIRNMDFLASTGSSRSSRLSLDDGRLLRLRARTAAGTILGPRIYTSGPWRGTTGGLLRDVAKALPAYKAAGYDFIKIHDEDAETADSVAVVARRIGMPIVGHVPAGVSTDHALAMGYKSIEHMDRVPYESTIDSLNKLVPVLKDPITYIDTVTVIPGLAELAEATKRSGVWIDPTDAPAEWILQYGLVPGGPNSLQLGGQTGFIHLRRRIIKAFENAGVGVLAGTDEMPGNMGYKDVFAFSGHPNDTLPQFFVQQELRWMVVAGLTPYQALATATRNPAVYFGTIEKTGTINVGKRADLVLLTANPLADIENTNNIAGVVVNGRWFTINELDLRLAKFDADHP